MVFGPNLHKKRAHYGLCPKWKTNFFGRNNKSRLPAFRNFILPKYHIFWLNNESFSILGGVFLSKKYHFRLKQLLGHYYGAKLKSSKRDANEISYPLFNWRFFNRVSISRCQCSLLYSEHRSLVVSGTGRLPLPPYIFERTHLLRRESSYLFNLRILVVSHSYSLTVLMLWSLKS